MKIIYIYEKIIIFSYEQNMNNVSSEGVRRCSAPLMFSYFF
jgi:hypothetical protein